MPPPTLNSEEPEKDPVAYSPYTFHPKKRGISHVIRYFTEYEKLESKMKSSIPRCSLSKKTRRI